jgi:predicted TPR repeat methyltransferase
MSDLTKEEMATLLWPTDKSKYSAEISATKLRYAKAATCYEKNSLDLGYGNIWKVTEKLTLEYGTVPKGGRMLDAGCGSGLLRSYIPTKDADELYGFDLCDDMLQVAKSTGVYSDLRLHDLFNALPYTDEFFETIYCMGVLGYINTNTPLKEFQRCLKPGGYLMIALREEHFDSYRYPEFLESSTSCTRYAYSGRKVVLMTTRLKKHIPEVKRNRYVL